MHPSITIEKEALNFDTLSKFNNITCNLYIIRKSVVTFNGAHSLHSAFCGTIGQGYVKHLTYNLIVTELSFV